MSDNDLYFRIRVLNEDLVRQVREAQGQFGRIGDAAEREGRRIDAAFKQIAAGIAGYFTLSAAKNFAQQIMAVRGEFEQLEIAFTTMLKGKGAADKLMGELVDFAAKTPYGLQAAASAAKQLIAYGSRADEVVGEMRMLGDAAAGTGQSIGDIAYLYGTLRTQGRAYLMDIRQFAGRGIPIYEELAKVLGVNKDRVNEFVSAGRVGFAEIEQAFKNMTAAGGIYGGLMEAQSKSITGRMEQLKDAVSVMLNDIGKSSEGAVHGVIGAGTAIVENYKQIGRVLGVLIGTYGTYRAALLAAAAVQKIQAAYAAAQVFAEQTRMLSRLTQAQILFNRAAGANPYIKLAAVLIGIGGLIWAFAKNLNGASQAQGRLNEVTKEYENSIASERAQIDILFGRLRAAKEGTQAYQKAKDDIITKYGQYLSGLGDEARSLKDIALAYKAVSGAALQAAKDRALENGTRQAADTYAKIWEENIGRVREMFVKGFGAEQGGGLFENLRGQLEQGGELTEDMQKVIGGFGYRAYGGMYDKTGYMVNPLLPLIENIREGKKTLDKEIEDINGIFGRQDAAAPAAQEQGQVTALKTLVKEIKQAQGDLAALQGQTQWSADEEKRIGALSEQLKQLKEQYKTLTGRDYDQKGGGAPLKEKDYSDELRKNALEQERALEDLELERQRAQTALMDEGFAKEAAQLELNHRQKLIQIRRQGEDVLEAEREYAKKRWEAANPAKVKAGVKFEGTPEYAASGLNPAQAGWYGSANADKSKRYADGEAAALENKAYEKQRAGMLAADIEANQNYYQKRERLAREEKIARLPVEFAEQARQNRDADLAKMDADYQAHLGNVQGFFKDMSGKSAGYMRDMAQEAEAYLAFLEGGTYSAAGGRSFGITQEQFNVIRDTPAELDKVREKVAAVRAQADASENAFAKMAKGLKDVFNAAGDKNKAQAGLGSFITGMDEAMGVANALQQTLSGVFSSFGMQGADAQMMDGIMSLVGGTAQAGMGVAKLASGDIVGGIKDTVAGLGQIIQGINGVNDAAHQKNIEVLQKQYDRTQKNIDAAERRISKLQKDLNKQAGADAKRNIEEQNRNEEQNIKNREAQIKNLQKQISEENGKKNTDDGKVKQMQEQIEALRRANEDAREQIADNRDAMIDALTGGDITSAVNDFASALVDAWAGGTDAAQGFGDVTKKMLRQAVTEMIKADDTLENFVDASRKRLAAIMEDGVLTAKEKANYEAWVKKEEAAAAAKMQERYGWLSDTFAGEGERTAAAKGFGAMTQDSAEELNGRFTALQALTSEINNNVKILAANSGAMLAHLADINGSTRRLAVIEADMGAVKASLGNMETKGITISAA